MSVSIRALADHDLFEWVDLFTGYCEAYEREATDESALTVWRWLRDGANPLNCLVAVDDDDTVVGILHYHLQPRPLDAGQSIVLDDLYVDDSHREGGIGTRLINEVREIAARDGIATIRMVTPDTNTVARSLFERLGRRTDLVTYETGV